MEHSTGWLLLRSASARFARYLEIDEKLAVVGAGRAVEPAASVGHRFPVRLVLLLDIPGYLMHQKTTTKPDDVPRAWVDELDTAFSA